MNKRDEVYLAKMQKKLGCHEENCGTNFIFTVTEHDFKTADWKKKILKGRCKKCSKYLKLSKAGLFNFGRVMGPPEVEEVSNNFNDLFDIEGQ